MLSIVYSGSVLEQLTIKKSEFRAVLVSDRQFCRKEEKNKRPST